MSRNAFSITCLMGSILLAGLVAWIAAEPDAAARPTPDHVSDDAADKLASGAIAGFSGGAGAAGGVRSIAESVVRQAEGRAVRLTFNPYEDIDWQNTRGYKMELHAHVRGAYDEVAELIRVYTGDAEDRRGHRLAEGDEYHIPAVSYGTGPDCHYWPWDSLSQYACWNEDFDPVANNVIGVPVVEIDDVRHLNAVFSYGLPNDVSDDFPAYSDWKQAIDIIIKDTKWTVVDGAEEATPLLMPAHPARYYDKPGEDGIEAYREAFEKHSLADGLIGIEALTKAWDPWRNFQRKRNARRWDDVILAGLLTDLEGREGPCLMFGVDDTNHHRIGHDIDRRWTTVLLAPGQFNPEDQDASRRAIYEALKAGRIFASQRVPWDHPDEDPPPVPVVNAVIVNEQDQTITVRAEGGEVVWVNAHGAGSGDEAEYLRNVVARGPTFNYGEHAEVVADSHIIPHVIGPDRKGETLLQPFTFERIERDGGADGR